MKRIFLIITLVITAASCSRNSVNIKGIVEGLNRDTLVLKVLAINNEHVKDTIITEEGKIIHKLKMDGVGPDFCYLYYKNILIASFVALPGDYIKFSTDTSAKKIVVEGSPESQLLTEIDKQSRRLKFRYDSLLNLYNIANVEGDKERAKSINYELGSLYVKHKQNSIKKIFTQPNSITNVVLLYEKLPNGLPIFADSKDVLIFTRVRDSLLNAYPASPYLKKLSEDIERMDNINLLNSRLSEANQTSYPELTLPDLNANKISLSSFSGNVILLSFWNSVNVDQRLHNQEYLSLYDKYSNKGLVIYQVAVDTDKTSWANTVREQMLPWISVCDGLGTNSPAVKSYNITSIPSNFLIDKNGVITARNLFGEELEKSVIKLVK